MVATAIAWLPSGSHRMIDVPLPSCCPNCGGQVEHERTAEQFQVELPEMRLVTTKFTVRVGRCRN